MQYPLDQILDSPYSVIYTIFITLKYYYPKHIVTKLKFRYKSGSCSRSHTRIAVSISLLLWYRQTPKCCFSCPHKWQSVLRSYPFLYVLASLRYHRHGCPLDHLKTLRNIAWYAALSLRIQHNNPSIISEVRWGDKFHTQKPPRTSSRKHASNVVDIAHRLTYLYNLTLAPPVACYRFYKCCHLPRNKTPAE
jgi:hypothetical protein